MKRSTFWVTGLLVLVFSNVFSDAAMAQQRGAGPAAMPRSNAAIDMTGHWVSVVTEDWRFRMVTAPKGEYGGVPINAAARRIADAWDPARDEAAGEQCKAFGAGGVMRQPGHLRISWENDTTLKIETTAGTQTRLLHFGNAPAPTGARTGQGHSVAEWEYAAGGRGQARTGNLKVVTTHLRPGYLRRNGVPYGENAVVTEWVDRQTAPNGDVWLIFNVEVNDPEYLTTPFITSSHFKKLPDDAPWVPEPCTAK